MSSLDDILSRLHDQPGKPPVERWHPPLSGDIDIRIDRRGDWYHDGVRFERQALIKLFASILRREDDGEYYLVTPVEKWRIRVEAAPLVAVDLDVVDEPERLLVFRLNTDELVALDVQHRLEFGNDPEHPQPRLLLDRGLSASLTTSVYYRLMALDNIEELLPSAGG